MRQASRPLYWHSIAASRRPRIARKRNDQWAVVTTSPECDGGQISAARGARKPNGIRTRSTPGYGGGLLVDGQRLHVVRHPGRCGRASVIEAACYGVVLGRDPAHDIRPLLIGDL
jgi:hypothetical protein